MNYRNDGKRVRKAIKQAIAREDAVMAMEVEVAGVADHLPDPFQNCWDALHHVIQHPRVGL